MNIEATSMTVRWTKPADDGGGPITAYRVLILRGNTEIENRNITDFTTMQLDIGDLTRSTNYTIKLFARNYVFEGKATEKKTQTKFEGRIICKNLAIAVYSLVVIRSKVSSFYDVWLSVFRRPYRCFSITLKVIYPCPIARNFSPVIDYELKFVKIRF